MARTALLDRLHDACDTAVLSVAAPPGYGKTTLLCQWAARAPYPVAWLSIEADDNDPAVLLADLVHALDRVRPVDTDGLRPRMHSGTPVAALVARRVAAALSSMDPVALVLDHTDLLRNRQCRDAVAELAVRVPPGAHLVVASRGAPPVPVALLRARGSIVELDTDDLAMDAAEARQVLEGAGVGPTRAELADVVERTEGWPIGLYLGALAMDGRGRRRRAGFALTGDDRVMADYLRTEVLGQVPRGRVSFLTRTSVLDAVCGPLCDAVLGREGSAALLDDLAASNRLLVPLDRSGGWYRYHRLFRELLRAELARREPDVVEQIQVRAAAWCEANGQPEAAIRYAQDAGDVDRAVRLIAGQSLVAYADGRLETIDQWLRWLDSHQLVEARPPLAAMGAVLLAVMGQAAAAERWAATAERAAPDARMADGSPLASWVALVRALLCRHGLEQMRRDAETAGAGLAPGSRWRSAALAMEGISWLLDGRPDRADRVLADAVAVGLDTGAAPAVAIALAERAVVAMRRDDWEDASRILDRALGTVREGDLEHHPPTALVHALAARIAARRGDSAGAQEGLNRAARLRPQLADAVPVIAVQALVELGRAYLAVGDAAGARTVLREAGDVLRLRPGLGTLPDEVEEVRSMVDAAKSSAAGASTLTSAELRMVPLLATHLSFRQIGERLHVSRHTVKTQAMSVYRKLGVSSRGEAMERVQEIGLLGG